MKNKEKYSKEQKIYWDIEAPFLYDYVNFANNLRKLQALETNYEKYGMDQTGRRLHLVLLTEIYQKSLEDLAVILLSFYRRFNQDVECDYQKKFAQITTPLTHTIINYKIKEAELKKVLDKCATERDFINKLHINDLDTMHLTLVLPLVDLPKFYHNIYFDTVAWMGDQEKRFRMYNKIKHGPVVVGSAKILNKSNENAPAVIYADEKAGFDDHPLIVHSLHFKKTEFVLLQSGVVKISDTIKDLISAYLCKNYPDFLKEKGFSSPLLFFKDSKPPKK